MARRETNAIWLPDFKQREQDLLEHDRPAFTFLTEVHGEIGILDGNKSGQCPDESAREFP